MKERENKDLINKEVLIYYNDVINNVSKEVGKLIGITDDFYIIEINERYKYISKNKIIRVEVKKDG